MCLCAAMWAWIQLPGRPQEGIRFPKAGVTGSFEWADLSARNWPMVLHRRNTLFTAEPSHKPLEGSVNAKHSINSCLLTGHVGIHLQCQHPGNGSRRIAEWFRPAWSTPHYMKVKLSACVQVLWVCMSVSVCMCARVCMYVCMRVCMCIVQVCVWESMCICMCVSVCVWVCTCVRVYVYVRVYECVHVCTHIRAVTPYWCEAKFAMKYSDTSREKRVCMPRIKCK